MPCEGAGHSPMPPSWTRPATYADPRGFDSRYSAENLSFWAPHLMRSGRLIIRTITPEAAQQRMPFRFFPRMAKIEAARLPTSADLEALLTGAGFALVATEVVERHKA